MNQRPATARPDGPQSKKFSSLGSQPKVLLRSAPRSSACACECRARARPTSRGRLSRCGGLIMSQNLEMPVELSKFTYARGRGNVVSRVAARLAVNFFNRKNYWRCLACRTNGAGLELVGAAKKHQKAVEPQPYTSTARIRVIRRRRGAEAARTPARDTPSSSPTI